MSTFLDSKTDLFCWREEMGRGWKNSVQQFGGQVACQTQAARPGGGVVGCILSTSTERQTPSVQSYRDRRNKVHVWCVARVARCSPYCERSFARSEMYQVATSESK